VIGEAVGSVLRGSGGRFSRPNMTDIVARQSDPRVVERVATIQEDFNLPQLPTILNIQQAQEVVPKPGVRGAIERLLPGGKTGFIVGQSENGALPMIGPFGVEPGVKEVAVRVCPSGMRLGIDGLCYPKQLLAKRSKLRAWPAEMAPPITNSDRRALNKIDSVRTKVKKMGKKADLKVTNR